jgi:hypothetical protein
MLACTYASWSRGHMPARAARDLGRQAATGEPRASKAVQACSAARSPHLGCSTSQHPARRTPGTSAPAPGPRSPRRPRARSQRRMQAPRPSVSVAAVGLGGQGDWYGLTLKLLPISAGGRGGGGDLPRPRGPGVGPHRVPSSDPRFTDSQSSRAAEPRRGRGSGRGRAGGTGTARRDLQRLERWRHKDVRWSHTPP